MDPKIILFLDDDPLRAVRQYEWSTPEDRLRTIWAKTVTETLLVLKEHPEQLEVVHLDHDLEGETFVDSRRDDCGMEVVRWLENIAYDKRVKFVLCHFIIHTHNERAGRQMKERISALGLKADYIPFGTEKCPK